MEHIHSKCCNAKVRKQHGTMFCDYCLSPLSNSQVKRNSKLIYVLLLILLFLFLLTKANAPNNKIIFGVWKHVSTAFTDVALNDSSITEELIKDGCVLPNVAIAQAHIESAHYTSQKTFDNKNIFGIKPHKCKYVKGVNRYQAVYSSYKDCIACYCHIQQYYLKSIDGHYAANSAYIDLIKKVN